MVGQAWRWFIGQRLLSGSLATGLSAAVFLGLLVLLAGHRGRRWFTRRVPLAVLATVLLLGIAWGMLLVLKPFPDGLPWTVPLWIGAALLAVCLAVVGWPGQRWWRRGLAVLALVSVVLGAANDVNRVYQPFPTVSAALQLPPYDEVTAGQVLTRVPSTPVAPAQWSPPAGMPATGALTQVTIPATTSGFPARPGWLYLPPAYLTPNRPLLPVWVMLGGQPGSPRDWIDGGQLAHRLDAWAAAHHGLAPVVVMPDDLGGEVTNPLCLDSAIGRADSYLSVDVPAWVQATLQVDTDHAHWAVGGFSYGGTCALQLAVGHPSVYPTFFDVSGQRGPTLGGRADTVQATFAGDTAAFDAVDPLHELTTRRYSQLAAYIAVGSGDREYLPQARDVTAALRAAGAAVNTAELPGRHSWDVWGAAFQGALPWLAGHTGLPA